MDTEPNRVIVTISELIERLRSSPRFSRDPCGRDSPKEAASHLIHQLTRALDSALTDWRRDRVNNAIADVQTFVDQGS